MRELALRNFKRFWLGGIALFLFMVFTNFTLITNISPMGISDHQSAGTAENINVIQEAWVQADAILFAKVSVIIDLIFIGVYAFGAFCGGILLRYDSRQYIKRIGSLIIAASIIFLLTDYIETISQAIQLFTMQGSDILANIAAMMGPMKIIAFLATIFGLLGTILWDKFYKR